MSLKQMFLDALERNGETLDDVILMSHPMAVLEQISTLEEIQCWYLNGCGYLGDDDEQEHWKEKGVDNPVHKQDMPFIAATRRNIYYNTVGMYIQPPDWKAKSLDDYKASNIYSSGRYVHGVECYSRDD